MRNKGLWQSKDDVILMRPNTQAAVSRALLYYPPFRRDLFDNFIYIKFFVTEIFFYYASYRGGNLSFWKNSRCIKIKTGFSSLRRPRAEPYSPWQHDGPRADREKKKKYFYFSIFAAAAAAPGLASPGRANGPCVCVCHERWNSRMLLPYWSASLSLSHHSWSYPDLSRILKKKLKNPAGLTRHEFIHLLKNPENDILITFFMHCSRPISKYLVYM